MGRPALRQGTVRDLFKTYTEKVWGLPCSQISVDWASQRIRALNLSAALRSALVGNGAGIKSLVSEFSYPRLGAGQVYRKMADAIEKGGGRVLTGVNVRKIRRKGSRLVSMTVEGPTGQHEFRADQFLTSAPLTDVIQMTESRPLDSIVEASHSLRYRDHISVNLVVRGNPFPDNWIYVHSNDVAVARIANYRNFSAEMGAHSGLSPITAEYFGWPSDELSTVGDAALVTRAIDELRRLGIVNPSNVVNAFVVRSNGAYPAMDLGYQDHVMAIRSRLDSLEILRLSAEPECSNTTTRTTLLQREYWVPEKHGLRSARSLACQHRRRVSRSRTVEFVSGPRMRPDQLRIRAVPQCFSPCV